MQIISNEEARKYQLKVTRTNHPVTELLPKLVLGGRILMSKEEWGRADSSLRPYLYTQAKKFNRKFKLFELSDESGYIIQRTA